MSNEKYKLFKNFLHNELKLTKEDIRIWIFEAIEEEVRKVVKEAYQKCDLQENIRRQVQQTIVSHDVWTGDKLKSHIENLAIKELTRGFELQVVSKKEISKPVDIDSKELLRLTVESLVRDKQYDNAAQVRVVRDAICDGNAGE
jgi:hypothetical protein